MLYPAIDLEQFDRKLSKRERDDALRTLPAFSSSSIVLLSINRFERKKNLALAIEAMGELVSRLPSALADNVHLVMAGGYDERVEENVEHFKELRAAVGDLSLEGRVHFVRSFTNDQRLVLMEFCRCVIYTPDKEHFGIVPVEAMYASRPVVAVASGGPLESVIDGKTGFLAAGNATSFADALEKLVADLSENMGSRQKARRGSNFLPKAFGDDLDVRS